MTTSTLERIDWATILDDSPRCEHPDGCDREATYRIFWGCGCVSLACQVCVERCTVYLAMALHNGHHGFRCRLCSAETIARCLSDLMRAMPL